MSCVLEFLVGFKRDKVPFYGIILTMSDSQKTSRPFCNRALDSSVVEELTDAICHIIKIGNIDALLSVDVILREFDLVRHLDSSRARDLMEAAFLSGNKDLVRLMIKHEVHASVSADFLYLYAATSLMPLEIFQDVLEATGPVHIWDKSYGETLKELLHEQHSPDTLEFMLSMGCPVDLPDNFNDTLMHHIISLAGYESGERRANLVAKGARVMLRDPDLSAYNSDGESVEDRLTKPHYHDVFLEIMREVNAIELSSEAAEQAASSAGPRIRI